MDKSALKDKRRETVIGLLKGMNIDDVITRLQGIRCGMKPTSCPDQIAKGLESYKNQL